MKILKKYSTKFLAITAVMVAGVLLTGSLRAQTATASLYLSPASISKDNGQEFNLAARVNTNGNNVNAVQADITYNVADLDYVSTDGGGSDFSFDAGVTASSGSISISRAHTGNVTGDKLVATVKFKTKKGSGSSNVTFANSSVVLRSSDSQNILSSKTGATVTFTTPAPPPTTPPPTTPPPTIPPPTTTPTTEPSPEPSAPAATPTAPNRPVAAPTPAPGAASAPSATTTATATVTKLEFTRVAIEVSGSKPFAAYIKYGIQDGPSLTTPQTGQAANHVITLDENMLVPGTTYNYQLVTVDQGGSKIEGEVQSFTTKGFTLHLLLKDSKGKALGSVPVTLYSEPKKGTTDADGHVQFSDVAPGNHEVEVEVNGKKVKQSINVKAEVTEVNGEQTSSLQSFDLVFNTRASFVPPVVIRAIIGLVIAAAMVALVIFAIRFYNRHKPPLTPGPTVGTGSSDSASTPPASTPIANQSKVLPHEVVGPSLAAPASATVISVSPSAGQPPAPLSYANQASDSISGHLSSIHPVSSHAPGEVITPNASQHS